MGENGRLILAQPAAEDAGAQAGLVETLRASLHPFYPQTARNPPST
jgi:hypothetical protein